MNRKLCQDICQTWNKLYNRRALIWLGFIFCRMFFNRVWTVFHQFNQSSGALENVHNSWIKTRHLHVQILYVCRLRLFPCCLLCHSAKVQSVAIILLCTYLWKIIRVNEKSTATDCTLDWISIIQKLLHLTAGFIRFTKETFLLCLLNVFTPQWKTQDMEGSLSALVTASDVSDR